MSDIKRIPLNKLEIGMYVTEQSEGVADGRVQEKGFIRREETLRKLQAKKIAEVYIDVKKGKDSPFALPVLTSQTTFKARVVLDEERSRAEKVYGEARGLMSDIIANVKMGKAIDVAPVEELAEDINDSILNNPNALLCLSQIREKDQYLLEHSINVGLLISVFSTHLGYDKATVKELTMGGLLHDIGKIRVPYQVLNKPGKLTDDEWVEMKMHVAYGQAVLQESKGISDIAKSICGLHHERLDGTGYPMGLSGDEINVYGRMAAVVDVYDAVTASRCYHKGMSPFEAMKLLVKMSEDHLDKGLVYSFIRCMSVYPVGTVVELNNGLVGVVIEPNLQLPSEPKIRTFFNSKRRSFEAAKVVDLAKLPRDSKAEHKIMCTREAEEFKVDIRDYL
ncbi:3'3'-cGAMP-specific phosphodiesterase 1 [Thalassocella blandensis]|nr:3'3'-cGAMP-specific phosphodiesterase 1 [Thalassocella blandensis]